MLTTSDSPNWPLLLPSRHALPAYAQITHDLEDTYDFVHVHQGDATASGILYASVTGTGSTTVTVPAASGAVTLRFTSDDKGRRGGFKAEYNIVERELRTDCGEGEFGYDCAMGHCMAQNAPFTTVVGTLAMQTGEVPRATDCSWALPSILATSKDGQQLDTNSWDWIGYRIWLGNFDLEPAAAASSADRVELAIDGVQERVLWVKSCSFSDECNGDVHSGACVNGTCSLKTAHDISLPSLSSSLTQHLTTDRNDVQPHSGVTLQWMPVVACPVPEDVDAPSAQCLQAGGSCFKDACFSKDASHFALASGLFDPALLSLIYEDGVHDDNDRLIAWACQCGGEYAPIPVVQIAVSLSISALLLCGCFGYLQRSSARKIRAIKQVRPLPVYFSYDHLLLLTLLCPLFSRTGA